MNTKIKILLFFCLFTFSCAQTSNNLGNKSRWSVKVADTYLARHPGAVTYDSLHPNRKWNYEQGIILFSLFQTYLNTKDEKYLNFIEQNLNQYIKDDGQISTYKLEDFNLDNILPGRVLLELYRLTGKEKYKKSADILRDQLKQQPRTKEGGFWHKRIYPYQMWLDGLYMAGPFYTRYAQLFNEKGAFDDIANQFLFVAKHTYNKKTGLYFHGWDESREQKWANPETGCSPNFWSRSMGWYMMALVDVLDYFPKDHPKRNELLNIFIKLAESLSNYRSKKEGLWYQVTDRLEAEGNYLEASASCMFGYAYAKGVSKGYLNKKYLKIAEEIFNKVVEKFIKVDENGMVDLYGTCKSAGLGGNPYRDGSYEYYISEPIRINDMKGIGAFILFALEIEKTKF